MLLPALSKARDAAQMAKCSSNQKQISSTMMYYIDDYNDFFPAINRLDQWTTANGHPFSANVWQEALGGLYLDYPTSSNDWGGGRHGIFECPGLGPWRAEQLASGSTNYASDAYGVDYGVSYDIIDIDTSNGHISYPRKYSKIKKTIIMVAETSSANFRDPNNTSGYGIRPGHNNNQTANYLFIDGHVEKDTGTYDQLTGSDYPWDDLN